MAAGAEAEAPSAWKQGFKSRLSAAVGAAATARTAAAAAPPSAATVSAPVSASAGTSASAVVKTGSSLIGAVTPEKKALRAEGDKGDKGAVRERVVAPGSGGENSGCVKPCCLGV